MNPGVGDIVHYQPWGGSTYQEPVAAIVTRVYSNGMTVDLELFVPRMLGGFSEYPGMDRVATAVQYSTDVPGCWYWPPRV